MRRYDENEVDPRDIFVGIDVHVRQWHVTVMALSETVFSGAIAGNWPTLQKLLLRWERERLMVAYEAGYSGFWLHDELVAWGVSCVVAPPSFIPTESGTRVKTDRRDSTKLALLLSRGLLKRVWVPNLQQRLDREVIRQRRRLVRDRRRVQSQIKALLRWYGIDISLPVGHWPEAFVTNLWRLQFAHEQMQASFQRLVEQYQQVTDPGLGSGADWSGNWRSVNGIGSRSAW